MAVDGTIYTGTASGPGGASAYTTIWLPAQTTPYTPRSYCVPSIYCSSNSNCAPLYMTEQMQSSITLVTNSAHDCFPSGFYDINARMEVAYQGTICPSGWHNACETTFQLGGLAHTQTWCCPAGQFECVTLGYAAGFTARRCLSRVLAPTSYSLRFEFSGELDGSILFEGSTVTLSRTLPPDEGFTYRIEAFPLQRPAVLTSSTSTHRTSSSLVPSTSMAIMATNSTSGNDTLTTSTLSNEKIAGIAIGMAGFVGIGAFMVIQQIRHRRRLASSSSPVMDHGDDPYQGKPELPDNSVPRAAELEPSNATALLSEMEGDGMHPEMDGRSKPVEAPTPEPRDQVTRLEMDSTIANHG